MSHHIEPNWRPFQPIFAGRLPRGRNFAPPPERRTPFRPGGGIRQVHADTVIGAPFWPHPQGGGAKLHPFLGQGFSSLERVRVEREFIRKTRHENMAWPTDGVLNFQTGLQQYEGDTKEGLR